jgi:hypothetical protein
MTTRWPAWLVHPHEHRLRAPWRLAIHLVTLLVFGLAFAIATWPLHLPLHVVLLVQAIPVVVSTLLLARFVDRRPLAGVGLAEPERLSVHVVVRAAVGALLIALVAATETALGLATYTRVPLEPRALSFSVVLFAAVGLNEELLFRGYYVTNLAEAWGGSTEAHRRRGVIAAVAVTSLVFAGANLFNPNVSVLSIVNIALAGLMLALPYALTGELGLSIGVHLGWNLAQSWLGMAVSGNEIPGRLLARALVSDGVVTGGAFGAEGGLLGLGALALGSVILVPLSFALRRPERARALGMPPVARRAITRRSSSRC